MKSHTIETNRTSIAEDIRAHFAEAAAGERSPIDRATMIQQGEVTIALFQAVDAMMGGRPSAERAAQAWMRVPSLLATSVHAVMSRDIKAEGVGETLALVARGFQRACATIAQLDAAA